MSSSNRGSWSARDFLAGAGLVAALLLVYWYDHRRPASSAELPGAEAGAEEAEKLDEPPPFPGIPEMAELAPPVDPQPRVDVKFSPNGRFGLATTSGNPDDPSDDGKKLLYSPNGDTNNTRVHVNGSTPIFGDSQGQWIQQPRTIGTRTEAIWKFQGIEFTQRVELAAGDVSRRTDGLRVTYECRNAGLQPQTVGLRVMLDTFIGGNDGVPFIVPGIEGIVTQPRTFLGNTVPDFVRAIERPDLNNPGVIVDLGLRGDERPDRLVRSHWPGGTADWDYESLAAFGADSAVGIYYAPRPLGPGKPRTVSFTYGLGSLASTQTRNARLRLTAGGPFRAGGSFWILALVQDPKANQRVRLTLPSGLSLDDNDPATKPIQKSDRGFNQASWLVHAARDCSGNKKIVVDLLPDGVKEEQSVHVSPLLSRLRLVANSPITAKKSFRAVAVVQNPQEGQTLKLVLPAGIRLGPGESATKNVPADGNQAKVNWVLRADTVEGDMKLRVELRPEDAEAECTVTVRASSMID